MLKFVPTTLLLLISIFTIAQSLTWQSVIDTSTTFSSPRAVELTNDGVLDIVIGGGLDGSAEGRGVVAIDGIDGSLIWSFPTEEEIFASPQFMDINGDNIEDVFIGGRYAELYAIDGATGNMIWEFFTPPPAQAIDSGWYNFYSLQFVPDQNSDGYPDILAANGGNHSLPSWDTLRDPGLLMIIDAVSGNILAQDTMPDGEETYCSPVASDIDNDGSIDIIYGSGGENDKGSLWRTTLTDLMNNDISGSIAIITDPNLGFIAPVSLAKFNNDNVLDIVCQAYDGTAYLIDGATNSIIWSYDKGGVESSSVPTIGNLIGDATPDVFLNLAKGSAPSFFDYYQVVIDGATGNLAWVDSISDLHFASSAAVDIDHNGRDEIIASINYHNGTNFTNQLVAFDIQGNQTISLHNAEGGVNLGSAPLVTDLEGDGFLDFVYAFRADSLNPMGAKGFKVNRLATPFEVPAVGISWGSYMGTLFDGVYNYLGTPCGTIAVAQQVTQISCNGMQDGSVKLIPSGGVAPYTYVWSNGEITDSIGALSPGSYSCNITDSSGCVEIQNINIIEPYIISFGGVVSPACPGENSGLASVSSTGCPCMFSGCLFDWSNGDSIKNANGLSAGYAVVTITHLDGCIVIDSVLVPESYPLIDSLIITHQQCATETTGSGSVEILSSNPNVTTYNWDDGDVMATHDSLDPGNTFVLLTDNRGCIDSLSFTVLGIDSVQLNLSVSDISCTGLSDGVAFSAVTGGLLPYYYSWSTGDTVQSSSNLSVGYHILSLTDSLHCTVTDSVIITEPSALSVNLNVINETGSCDGSIEAISSGGTPGYSVLWGAGATTSIVSSLCAGIYTFELTDANGCVLIDSAEVLNTLGINSHLQSVKAFPNPTSGLIQFSNTFGSELTYHIFDLSGKLIWDRTSSSAQLSFDLKMLESGMYLMTITNTSGFKKVFKLEKIDA